MQQPNHKRQAPSINKLKQQLKQVNEEGTKQLEFGPNPKKMQKLQYHDLVLDNLPSADNYQLSYMHRDTITQVLASSKQNLIITSSIDGHIKFWKKVFVLVQFIKNFKAHTGIITSIALNKNHDLLVSAGVDKTLKIFDILNCDLRTVIKLSFTPNQLDWIPQKQFDWQLIAVSQEKTGKIMIVDPNYQERQRQIQQDKEVITTNVNGINESQQNDKKAQQSMASSVLNTLTFHKHPIKSIKMCWAHSVCFSIDQRGFLEVWCPFTFDFPSHLKYKCKIEAQFLKLLSLNTMPISLRLSPKGTYLAVALKDRSIRLFSVLTGKLITTILQPLSHISQTQSELGNFHHMDQNEYEKKMNLEKQLETSKQILYNPNVDFDQTEEFLIYTSFYGIKFYSLSSKSVEREIGWKQHERYLRIAVFQGDAMRNPAGSSNAQGQRKSTDPTIYCTAFRKNRFYIFSRRQPDLTQAGCVRDVINQRPNKEQIMIARLRQQSTKQREVILHTTLGDIHLELFVDDTPKTCENFIKLAKKSYYDGLIFHRVIKGFMVQTGCPKGDGTGGQSIWGHYFADQFCPEKHRFDKPYMVAMANRGPNTNGSQFFITVVPCPWLDNKHTVFGRVIKGVSTVIELNKCKTDKGQKPLMAIKILSTKVLKPGES